MKLDNTEYDWKSKKGTRSLNLKELLANEKLDFSKSKIIKVGGLLYFVAKCNEPVIGFKIYILDIETKQILWKHTIEDDRHSLKLKVVGEVLVLLDGVRYKDTIYIFKRNKAFKN